MAKNKTEGLTKQITITVNGNQQKAKVKPGTMLLDILRNQLGLTGTKVGCRKGECGACTVLVNGTPLLSCLFPALRAQGKNITTIEGLKKKDQLHPLQQAFIDKGAVQCGFCTPGMILAAKALLDQNPHPSLEDVRQALSGNLCRCGGYPKIFQAVLSVAKEKRRSPPKKNPKK